MRATLRHPHQRVRQMNKNASLPLQHSLLGLRRRRFRWLWMFEKSIIPDGHEAGAKKRGLKRMTGSSLEELPFHPRMQYCLVLMRNGFENSNTPMTF